MRKLVYLFLALAVATGAFAQKGSVGKAEAYLAKGELANAKAEVDVAITIEKTAAKSRTWFARGKIYQKIALSENEAERGLDDQAIEKAVEAYGKVRSMDNENTPNHLIAGTNLDQMWGEFINRGGTQYGDGDYESAYASFANSLKVRPEDSTSLLYAGVAAQQSEKLDVTQVHYYKLIEIGMASSDVFTTVIYIERSLNEDDVKALEVIRKAKEAYPAEAKFGQEEISVLIALDQLEEAKEKLKTAIEADPTNANLYLNLGILYDNLSTAQTSEGKTEEAKVNLNLAKENYEKTVENDADNYIGNFNLGAIYVNLAKEFYDKVRDMDLSTYDKEGPALIEKADGILKQGLPYMKKATELQPDEVDGLKALQQMYQQLKMMDEAEAVMNRVEQLESGQ